MPVVQRPYVPPEDQTPHEETYARPGDTQAVASNEASSLEPITFYADSMHIFSSLYSAVLFFGEQMEEREPILRARIKVSPQMLKANALLTAKHVRELRGRRRPHHPAGAGLRRLGAGHGGESQPCLTMSRPGPPEHRKTAPWPKTWRCRW